MFGLLNIKILCGNDLIRSSAVYIFILYMQIHIDRGSQNKSVFSDQDKVVIFLFSLLL